MRSAFIADPDPCVLRTFACGSALSVGGMHGGNVLLTDEHMMSQSWSCSLHMGQDVIPDFKETLKWGSL